MVALSLKLAVDGVPVDEIHGGRWSDSEALLGKEWIGFPGGEGFRASDR